VEILRTGKKSLSIFSLDDSFRRRVVLSVRTDITRNDFNSERLVDVPAPAVWIRDSGAKFKEPTVILGMPDVGLVGTVACTYLVDRLGLAEIGYIDSDLTPPVMVVHKGVPSHPVRIFAKDEIVVVLSEVPLFPKLSFELTREAVNWSKAHKATLVIGATGLPSREREESQAERKSVVLGLASDEGGRRALASLGIQSLEEGAITGGYASLLKHSMYSDQSCMILLGESLLSFPDPGAAAAVVEVLAKKLSIKIDLKPLMQESEEIRLRSRDLIRQTQQVTQPEQGTLPGVYK
jgi:uncharacterized protein